MTVGVRGDGNTEGQDALLPFHFWKSLVVWLVHAVAVGGLALILADVVSVTWRSVLVTLLLFVASSTAITAGYHRLFAHPTYTAAWPLRLFYLLFGSAAVQGSALQWAAQHRDHHTFTDGPRDPYNIKLGFWHAHMGWVLRRTNPDYGRVPDLARDSMVRAQHALFEPAALLTGFFLPAALGALWGEWLGALILAGFIRLTIQWHMTFCVNSVAHSWGSQKYCTSQSARGSWWLAFLVWGEMDHNYHHAYPNDFRTGTRWYDFDPGKWFISACGLVGLASDLRTASVRAGRTH